MRPYEKDPKAIYAQSFATVRSEANLARFPKGMAQLATRVIHACGMVETADRLAFSDAAYEVGALALTKGAPILCDCAVAQRKKVEALNDRLVAESGEEGKALIEKLRALEARYDALREKK